MNAISIPVTKQDSLLNAISHLDDILKESLDADGVVLDKTLHQFKLAFDLFWKRLQKALKHNGTQVKTPKEVFRFAKSKGWIPHEGTWIVMCRDAKIDLADCSKDDALRVYTHIQVFAPRMLEVTKILEQYLPSID